MKIRCPHCQNPIEVVEDSDYKSLDCPSCGSNFSLVDDRTTETHQHKKQTIAQYELLDKLGTGAFGSVWKARDTTLDRIVALKIPRKEHLDESDLEMFFREARAAAQLKHPSIVSVHEVGRNGNQVFIVSDFIDGVTLASKLTYERPTVEEAVTLVAKIADAIQAAHDAGVIHRDLKPSNVIIDKQGQPHVMDFGLAKRESGEITMTMDGARLGTPAYMPPEQIDKAHDADARSDVYSLGVILYELLTGELPFRGDKQALLHQLATKDPPSPSIYRPDLSMDLGTICLRCLEKDPAMRPQSAEFLAEDLRRYLDGKPIALRPISNVEKAFKWCKRNPMAVRSATVAIGGLMLAILATWFVRTRTHAEGLVNGLATADQQRLSEKLDEVEEYAWWTRSMIESSFEDSEPDSNERINLALALLRVNGRELPLLTEELMSCDIRRFEVLRSELASHKDELLERLWIAFRDENDNKRRFPAGLVLARYAPDDDERWTPDDAIFLVDSLLNQVPEDQPLYRRFLVDIKKRLYPELKRAFLDPDGKERQRLGAAKAFAEYALDDIAWIADVASEATLDQWEVLFSVLEEASPEPIHAALRPVVSEQPDESLSPLERVTFGKRRAGAAITLLRKGYREQIFDALRVTDDPESLTQFVHRCKDRGVTPQQLLECLDTADKLRQTKSGQKRQIEDRVLFGILLALGEFSLEDMPDSKSLIERLADWYAKDPSSAIHGATGWLLRHWGQEKVTRKVDETPVPYSPDREWYTLEVKAKVGGMLGFGAREVKSYMTFVVIPAGTYTIGSPENEPKRERTEKQHDVTITRPFAVLDREVTWAEAAMFNSEMANGYRGLVQKQGGWLPGFNEPWVTLNWYDSVSFCRWLTEQVGLGEEEQAYANPATLDKSEYPADPDRRAGGMPKDWPVDVHRRGFRLLTESEWEVACRGGTRVSWSYGGDARLLDRYGWFADNSEKRTHVVRMQRPNLRGLFDMHGNASEWCHDWYDARYGEGSVGTDSRGAETGECRVHRGGSWFFIPWGCRSSFRFSPVPSGRNYGLGFHCGAPAWWKGRWSGCVFFTGSLSIRADTNATSQLNW